MNCSPLERILRRVDRTGDCWIWTGATVANGYGYAFSGIDGRRNELVHRLVYRLTVGPIPDGLDLDHLCRTRLCCNPSHLEPVTRSVNVSRGLSGALRVTAQTHCKNGHEFTPENTRHTQRQRVCLTCERASGAAYRARKKAAA